MWQKLLTNIILQGVQKLISGVVGLVTDGMRTKKYKEVHSRLDTIEATLRRRPNKLRKKDAADLARKLNDIRSKL